jgi:hypothetical protein
MDHSPWNKPIMDEDPGPPLILIVNGAFLGFMFRTKNRKKECSFSAMSMYPEKLFRNFSIHCFLENNYCVVGWSYLEFGRFSRTERKIKFKHLTLGSSSHIPVETSLYLTGMSRKPFNKVRSVGAEMN